MSEMKDKDLAKVKELIEIMKENDLVEIEIADGDSKILLKRPQPQMQAVGQIPMQQAVIPAVVGAGSGACEVPAVDSNLKEITSPMVGTFYGSPSPDSDPFVKVGSRVDEGTVVCIIEAMKVMNEIKAEISGTIAEIICQPGQAIEFDEVLFKVRPD